MSNDLGQAPTLTVSNNICCKAWARERRKAAEEAVDARKAGRAKQRRVAISLSLVESGEEGGQGKEDGEVEGEA